MNDVTHARARAAFQVTMPNFPHHYPVLGSRTFIIGSSPHNKQRPPLANSSSFNDVRKPNLDPNDGVPKAGATDGGAGDGGGGGGEGKYINSTIAILYEMFSTHVQRSAKKYANIAKQDPGRAGQNR